MEEVDGVLLQVAPFVVVANDHPDVVVPGHTLHLAIGKAQAQCPRDSRPPQIVGR